MQDFAHVEEHVRAKLEKLRNSEAITNKLNQDEETVRLKVEVSRLRIKLQQVEKRLREVRMPTSRGHTHARSVWH